MFTEEQIKMALDKVKTGADFPGYIQQMKTMGVTYYETFLTDAHSVYHGENHFELVTPPKFEAISIADTVNVERLKADIAHHQQGESGFPAIVRQCAANGIAKWAVCMDVMTCTYYDLPGNKVLIEQIPESGY